jgi:hypothetical protein
VSRGEDLNCLGYVRSALRFHDARRCKIGCLARVIALQRLDVLLLATEEYSSWKCCANSSALNKAVSKHSPTLKSYTVTSLKGSSSCTLPNGETHTESGSGYAVRLDRCTVTYHIEGNNVPPHCGLLTCQLYTRNSGILF